MKNLNTFICLSLLTILLGCEDIPSRTSRPGSPPDVMQPPLEAGSTSIRSQIHRVRGTTPLTYSEEIRLSRDGKLPNALYRFVPNMEFDDEGTDGSNISSRSAMGRPTAVCGFEGSFNSITERMKDCLTKNVSKASWNGPHYGASGEGNWKLVSRSFSGQEVWLDETTKMVWSDVIALEGSTSFNWCQAAGNDQSATESASVDCNAAAEGISICHNLAMDGVAAQVNWRLPTRNDYLQADLNGLRFVLKPGSENGMWTATMKASTPGRTHAWLYHASGVLSTEELTAMRQVRCIGTPAL